MLTNSIKFSLIIYYIHSQQSVELTCMSPVEDPSFQYRLIVENSSPNTSFKYQVPVEDPYRSCEQIVREWQILLSNSP